MLRKISIALVCLALQAQVIILNGKKAVTTSGTAVALAASQTNAAWITVQALAANTGIICVGGPTILTSTKNGTCLAAGQAAPLSAIPGIVYNLANVYIDASVSGEGVSFTYAR